MLANVSVHSPSRGLDGVTCLEHESHGSVNPVGSEIGRNRGSVTRRVWSMAVHAIVQARAPGGKAVRLGVVRALDESHELAHDVSMKPGGAKRIFCHHPSWRKDHEIAIRRARRRAR